MPGVRRDSGGRRVYSPLHVSWLEFLERLKRTGMSVREMREYTTLVKRGEPTLTERVELLRGRRQLAVVYDEHARLVGLVTLEDLLEELVGDIRDEHDEPATDSSAGPKA